VREGSSNLKILSRFYIVLSPFFMSFSKPALWHIILHPLGHPMRTAML